MIILNYNESKSNYFIKNPNQMISYDGQQYIEKTLIRAYILVDMFSQN
jgi:hypothetical protein